MAQPGFGGQERLHDRRAKGVPAGRRFLPLPWRLFSRGVLILHTHTLPPPPRPDVWKGEMVCGFLPGRRTPQSRSQRRRDRSYGYFCAAASPPKTKRLGCPPGRDGPAPPGGNTPDSPRSSFDPSFLQLVPYAPGSPSPKRSPAADIENRRGFPFRPPRTRPTRGGAPGGASRVGPGRVGSAGPRRPGLASRTRRATPARVVGAEHLWSTGR